MPPSHGTDPRTAVSLRPMTGEEFEEWQESAIRSYAESIAQASGAPPAETLKQSRTQFGQLLPDGLDTANTWLLRLVDPAGDDVGVLWIGPHQQRPGVAYIYDIEIVPDRRGQGLGRAAMEAAEALVLEAGRSAIGLNVFGFNEGARRLYDSLGYRVVATQMVKDLTGS